MTTLQSFPAAASKTAGDTALRFVALDSAAVQALRRGGPDANGQPPERQVSDGGGNPCRHCLQDIAAGAPMLVLAHRPFPAPQPYAELGPIFVHAEDCPRYDAGAGVPAMLLRREAVLMRGYGHDDRIVYGTGRIVPTQEIESQARRLFQRADIAYLHLRSAGYNCFQCRIERA